MGVSGFVLELLVPGLVAVFAGLVLAWEFGLLAVDGPSTVVATAALSAFLVAGYLTGIALKFVGNLLVQPPHEVYRARLGRRWSEELPMLCRRSLGQDLTDIDESGLPVVSLKVTDELVARLSQYGSARYSDAWTERLFYHRNLARLSGNTQPSMVLLALVCGTGLVHRATLSDGLGVAGYSLAAVYVIGVGLSLRGAYVRRHQAYVDALVRTELAVAAREN